MSDSNELRVKWFGCHLIWDSNDFGCQLIWDSIDLVVNWFEIQMIWLSPDVCFKWFWLSVDLNFKWCGCQLIWDPSDSVVNWSEIQMIWLSIDLRFKWVGWCWLSIDLRFKWFGCQMIWGSNDLVVTWCVIQMILSNEAFLRDSLQNWSFEAQKRSFCARLPSKMKLWSSKTKDFCEISFKNEALKLKNEAFLRDFLQKWSFETQKRSISARLPSKLKLWSSKTKLFCETSFKNKALKLKNEAFLRDFLQKRIFEDQKRSNSARLPSKMNLWSSKTKHFCETSFKNESLKLKNEAFLRDFLQKWIFEAQKRSISARLPSKIKLWSSKTKLFCETSFKNDNLTRHLTSEFQYVLTIFNWTLQKYCACHEKVEPIHTKSCNCHAKWSLQSNASVTWNLQPFHGFSVQGFKHRHHKARNHCACHAKRIVSEPLQIHHACQRFCNPHELLRLPRILQRVEILAPATRNTLWTSKNVPRPSVFNDFDFQIALARRRGANFVEINFQKCSEHAAWCLFFVKIALARRRGANFVDGNFRKCSRHASF